MNFIIYLHFGDVGSGMSGGVCTCSGFGVLLGTLEVVI